MSSPGHQIVTFRLGEDLFAADINDVERVLRYAEPTPVPNVPPWVQGVIEYRSRVVPVIDLRVRFELPAPAPNGATRLMVLAADGEWIGAVVDAVLEVVPIGSVPLAPPPPLFKGMAADFLKGILRRNERLIIVLDVTRLLAMRDRLAFDRSELSGVAIPKPVVAVVTESPPSVDGTVATGASVAVGDSGNVADSGPVPNTVPPGLDLGIIRGSPDPAAGDSILQLLGTSDEPPQPDDSILRGGPAVPPTPDWGAPPRSPNADSEDEGTGRSDG